MWNLIFPKCNFCLHFFISLVLIMPKNTLIIEEKVQAIILLKEGYFSQEVAMKLERNIDHTTILQLKKKYKEIGKVENKPLSGHLCKLIEWDEHSIIQKILKSECNTTIDIQKILRTEGKLKVSANIIHKTLQRNELIFKVKWKKTPIIKKTS